MSLGENSLVAAYQGKGQWKSRPSGTRVVTRVKEFRFLQANFIRVQFFQAILPNIIEFCRQISENFDFFRINLWVHKAENLKKKLSKIPKSNNAATMVSAARRQIIGGGAPINKSRRRRPQIVGGGAARPAHGFMPKKRTVFGRRLAVACRRRELFAVTGRWEN